MATADHLPADPFSVTADWLDRVLPAEVLGGASLDAVTPVDIGSGTGIFGEIARLDLRTTGGDGSAPASLVVKMACTEPSNLDVALTLGIYERELTFYERVAPTTNLRVPACHHAGRADDGRFVLVLEDLSSTFDVGDQVVGATLGQAESVVDALAPFHARWWEHDELAAMSWLPVPNAPAYAAAVPSIYRAGLPVLQSAWADRVSPESIAVALALEPRFEEILHRTADGPTTLIHTDTRLDNLFFARDGSGDVAFIDFQLALRGRGVADIAYLVGTSVDAGVAHEHWESLLRRWHTAISSRGVEYPWSDCVRHYREAALYYLSGVMSLIGTFDAGNERGAAMSNAYCTRMLAHVVDIDARSVLD